MKTIARLEKLRADMRKTRSNRLYLLCSKSCTPGPSNLSLTSTLLTNFFSYILAHSGTLHTFCFQWPRFEAVKQ